VCLSYFSTTNGDELRKPKKFNSIADISEETTTLYTFSNMVRSYMRHGPTQVSNSLSNTAK